MSSWLSTLRALRCNRILIGPSCQRMYSTASAAEIVRVPCRSNGSITLDIHLSSGGQLGRNNSPALVLYLPHGPFGKHTERDLSNISRLRSKLPHPIVQINYRLNEHDKYPTPVHDVLCGFDWIVENLLPKRGTIRSGRTEPVGQMAVFGDFIGGSLATALALTECRQGEPGIVAASLINPVVDWVSFDQRTSVKGGPLPSMKDVLQESTPSLELRELLRLRTRLFKKPENYFDPFASPILFFRSAGAEVPPPSQDIPIEGLEQLSLLDRQESSRESVNTTNNNPHLSPVNDSSSNPILRKASRRFPGKALNLRLPQFHISTDSTSPLHSQASELAHVLRRSFARQSKYTTQSPNDFGRKVLLDDEFENLDEDQRALAEQETTDAKRNVELHVNEGSGGWNDGDHGSARMSEVARWLRQKLG